MSISDSDGNHSLNRTPGRIPQALSADAIVLRAEERPIFQGFFHTIDLPDTPDRDRRLPATGWLESPPQLLVLGDDIQQDVTMFIRRIGPWLLWRAGPPTQSDTRYAAIHVDNFELFFTFRLWPDGRSEGVGADGVMHDRFRSWKESLRDNPRHTLYRPG